MNDDPTKFDHDKMENLAKEALKKFKTLGWYVFLLHIEMVLKVAKSVGVK